MEPTRRDQDANGDDWLTLLNEGELTEDDWGPGDWLSDPERLPSAS